MLPGAAARPEGSYFTDSDRAAGIFGVLATGFSVLLGFLIFLGFESYDASRAGAETEALTVAQQIQTAQLPPRRRRRRAHRRAGLLRPIGHRTASGTGWRTARSARTSTRGAWRCSGRFDSVELASPQQEAAYSKWLDQTSDREAGPPGSHPRRRWGDAGPAVDRAVLHLGDRARVPARVRRQRRAGVGARDVHGQRRRRDRHHAAAAALPRRTPSTGASAGSSRRRWNAPCSSSTSSWR